MEQFEATLLKGISRGAARTRMAPGQRRRRRVFVPIRSKRNKQFSNIAHAAFAVKSCPWRRDLGKTVVLATLPKLLSLRPGDVTLVVAHRDELIEQTVEKMRVENPDAKIGVEKAERKAPEDSNIIVATVQTLSEKRLEAFVQRFHRRISLFIIDEAHHAAAPSYRAIVDAILAQRPEAMVLGFTATPNRGDGVRLVDVFEKIVYSMDARKAIDAGYLVPVKSYAVATTTNLDDIASRGGDFVIGQLAAAVNTVDRNARIVAAYKQHTPGMKALVFTASVEHARDIAEEFVANGVKAEWASGETPKDERETDRARLPQRRHRRARQLRPLSRRLRRSVGSGDPQRAADEVDDALHADHRPRAAPGRRHREPALIDRIRADAPRADREERRSRPR